MNLISHVPFDMCSLRKWCLISMCLVLECMTGFLVKLIALVLSHIRGIWLSKIPKSFNCCLSHMVWAQQVHAAMYSASAVERATHYCFLHCHEIKLDPSKWQVPLVLFLSVLQPAKSESEYPVKLNEMLPGYRKPTSLVPCKYFRILLAPLKWCECNSKNTRFFDILRNNLSWSWIGTLIRIGSMF